MIKYVYWPLLLLLTACVTSKIHNSLSADSTTIKSIIDEVTQEYAPDKRTAVFNIAAHGKVVSGETNLPVAKKALLDKLRALNVTVADSIILLPERALAGKEHAIVSVSVANLRAQPGHPAELVTQATLGTPLQVWKRERGWYLVQTPDKYLAWVEAGTISHMDTSGYRKWQQSEKLIFTQPFGLAYSNADLQSQTVSDLVYGDVLRQTGQVKEFFEVAYPDGRSAFVPASGMMKYTDWTLSRKPTEGNLVQSAKQLLGIPYLWGGTSFKGVDCSGFTKTVYFMNGLVLPRDASQQVNVGEEIFTKDGWQNLKPGDLLFFGIPARDGKPERVVHVGMWLGGNQEFIQAAGMVKISSFNNGAPNYDSTEVRRFLRAKRISPQAGVIDLRKTPLFLE